jgi:hypothetical protein
VNPANFPDRADFAEKPQWSIMITSIIGYPLKAYDRSAFWGGTEHSYTDLLPYEAGAVITEPDLAMASSGD